ncbi:hypothetical protein PR048_004670 [Dryococelus australis]|uniref:Uncharacterized protein n=1 Tax=Dryococelus australis TaxID=614101 RepID=A0ABQ9I612_9NEOP|nr:hypothetical protein PR048_004670 [Dryococelus australis]
MELQQAIYSSEELTTLHNNTKRVAYKARTPTRVPKKKNTGLTEKNWQCINMTRSLIPASHPQRHYRYFQTGKIPCFLARNDTGHHRIRPEVCSKLTRESHPRMSCSRRHSIHPWMCVSSDLFQLKGENFLIRADSYSGYFDFTLLRSTTSDAVIRELKRGSPSMAFQMKFGRMTSLNSPLMNSKSSDGSGIPHTAFPVPTLRYNGLAECYFQEAKNLIYKCRMDETDTMLALLHHRNTLRGKLGSPS